MNKLKHFLDQSKHYPHWWYGIGQGRPRTWWLDFLWKTIGGGGFFSIENNRVNPIYWFHYRYRTHRNKYFTYVPLPHKTTCTSVDDDV